MNNEKKILIATFIFLLVSYAAYTTVQSLVFTWSVEYVSVQDKIEAMRRENLRLHDDALAEESLGRLEWEARDMGYTPATYMYLHEEAR
jgi:hypothetical protein